MLEIIGAGMAGLLAANMLQRYNPIIYERQKQLPNNHTAVLRFRSPTVGDVLGIPFKKVTMIKATLPWSNPVAEALAYSFKCTGKYRSDRSSNAGTVIDDRYIAPNDLIQRMAQQLPVNTVRFEHHYTDFARHEIPIISTIPMPALMKALNYPDQPDFHHQKGVNVHAKIADCEAYVSLIVPDPICPVNRVSITGDEVIIECVVSEKYERRVYEDLISIAATLLGIPSYQFYSVTEHEQQYQKIAPIEDDARKAFLFWATDKHGIFSLGRFACWRPGLQTDDLVQDIRKIANWLTNRYDMNRSRK